jgi:hypothetical protein
MEVKSFSEIVPVKKSFDVGERIAFSELVDKEFIVKNYELFPSKFEGTDEFAVILIESEDQEVVTTTSSKVIIEQLGKIKDKLPVKVKLLRKNKYFTFS